MVTVRDPEHEDAYRAGIRDERARVLRIFDDVFAGAVVDDATQAKLATIAERILAGKDGRS